MNSEHFPRARPRNWRTEFGEDFPIPPQIDEWVRAGLLRDTSRHNDACPSFERGDHRIAIQHTDPEKREIKSGGWCYLIQTGDRLRFQGGPEDLHAFLRCVGQLVSGGESSRAAIRKRVEGEPDGHRDEVMIGLLSDVGTGWDVVDSGEEVFCCIPLDDVYEFKLTFEVPEGSPRTSNRVILTKPILQLERDARLSDGTRYDYAYRGGPISMSLARKLLAMRATGVAWMYFEQLLELRRQPTQWEYIG